ncbi:MAG: RsmB/NOP family class I SAM-dependent RNA methyltransferase, partial [Clostridia bacterium]|nr:RsmB/NOP family class I SAM-dependent RNA methyltransferase [Clostridia bacterium]
MITENLSPAFFSQMKRLLGNEYEDYLRSLEGERERGLRVNERKISSDELAEKLSLSDRIPFENTGFFIGERKLGAHPFHHAGLFYLQEPSAMLPVAAISPFLKGKILDLCAAPGGKSTQILNYTNEERFLVCNEIVPSRAAILSSNLERMGSDATVTCMNPQEAEKRFPSFFDAVIVDAPCSGEGMFRKEDSAVRDWSEANVNSCAARQYEILVSASKMLVPGGYMIYSTCTLNDVENEGVILKFLENNKNFSAVEPDGNVRK